MMCERTIQKTVWYKTQRRTMIIIFKILNRNRPADDEVNGTAGKHADWWSTGKKTSFVDHTGQQLTEQQKTNTHTHTHTQTHRSPSRRGANAD